jgi:hypothetical protein
MLPVCNNDAYANPIEEDSKCDVTVPAFHIYIPHLGFHGRLENFA